MPFRFAMAHRFFAARDSFFLPSAERRPFLEFLAFAGGFFAALGDAFTFTVSLARTTDAFALSSNSRKSLSVTAYWSITLDSNASTLFNRFRAFFAFIIAP